MRAALANPARRHDQTSSDIVRKLLTEFLRSEGLKMNEQRELHDSVVAWASRINESWQGTVRNIVETGKALIDAKADLPPRRVHRNGRNRFVFFDPDRAKAYGHCRTSVTFKSDTCVGFAGFVGNAL